MQWTSPTLIALWLVCPAPVLLAVDPIPESEQGPLASKLLEDYHGTGPAIPPRKLHVAYFTPSDRDPEPRYRERLDAIMEDIRVFYRDGMGRAGFGPKTFDLARDTEGRLFIHLVKGKEPDVTYQRSGFQQNLESDASSRKRIQEDCRPVLKAAGIDFDHETVLIFCNLAKWDEKTRAFSHHSPYAGHANQTSGWCFAVDTTILNLNDLPKKGPILNDAEWGKESLGKFNTIFIGGIAHELGHAFSLPHCGERHDEKPRGKSLMGMGNHTYREELRNEGPGTFLTMASAMRLAGRPLFNKSEKDIGVKPRLDKNSFHLSTKVTRPDVAGRPGALRAEGIVKGSPAIYGVIAYFDSVGDAYRAPTATAVPDENGHFAIELSDIPPTSDGQLRIECCHVNGAVTEGRVAFKLTRDGKLNSQQPEVPKPLQPLVKAVLDEDMKTARAELGKIEQSQATGLEKKIAQKLAATLSQERKLTPSEVPSEITTLLLGDALAKTSEVGWLQPAANRVPTSSEIVSPLLDSGEVHATGLYAHAPSRYVYELGVKWKTLRGTGGLHAAQQSYGSVAFIINADGKEIFRSAVIRKSARASYEVDVTGVKTLELVVENGGDGNGNDWGLWLDPMLSR